MWMARGFGSGETFCAVAGGGNYVGWYCRGPETWAATLIGRRTYWLAAGGAWTCVGSGVVADDFHGTGETVVDHVKAKAAEAADDFVGELGIGGRWSAEC